jgi:transposase
MTIDTHSVHRLEVVDTGRRRRWSAEAKRRIVAESLEGERLMSSTARRYGIAPSQLFAWRRSFGFGAAERQKDDGHFASVRLVEASRAAPGSGRMEVALPQGIRITVDADVDAEALSRVLRVLEGR